MPAAQNGIPHSQLLNQGSITVGIKPLTFMGKVFSKNWNTVKHQEIILAGQSSLRRQAKFSWRILRPPMPNKHAAMVTLCFNVNFVRRYCLLRKRMIGKRGFQQLIAANDFPK